MSLHEIASQLEHYALALAIFQGRFQGEPRRTCNLRVFPPRSGCYTAAQLFQVESNVVSLYPYKSFHLSEGSLPLPLFLVLPVKFYLVFLVALKPAVQKQQPPALWPLESDSSTLLQTNCLPRISLPPIQILKLQPIKRAPPRNYKRLIDHHLTMKLSIKMHNQALKKRRRVLVHGRRRL